MSWTNLLPIIFEGITKLPDILKSVEKLVEIFGSNKKNGDKKSAVYEAMSDEGKKKVDGLKKALNSARDADDREAAAKVLRKLANIYSEEAVNIAANGPTSKLGAEAAALSKNLGILADKIQKTNHPLPAGNRVGKNTHDPSNSNNQTLIVNKYNSSIIPQTVTDGNSRMYELALNSLKANTDSGANATPLDVFKVMINHDVPSEKAKEVVLSNHPDEKDSLAANIDKYMDASKAIKEKPTEMASDNEAKVMSKQEQLVA
jgi:hypothetical protein